MRLRFAILVVLALMTAAAAGCSRSSQARSESASPPPVAWSDSDGDGFPDNAELRSFDDRGNFRRWFTSIAEMQFYRMSDEWNAEQRDCAGLVRFALREALRRHDRPWFLKMGGEYEAISPDVRAYRLEDGPLGRKLFRTDTGAFKEGDLHNGKFSEFADARTLKSFNTVFVSRDRRRAESGDLLFFHQPWVQKFPYHVMIFIGEPREAGEGARDWVVYHTGSSASDEGTMKKVRLAVLDHHPDKRWRPVESNPNFLGFYRLKIVEERE
ncbi:MAG TPA: DUF1175 family protein [Blastocatellia bacterium]|nr:DUF1175 family protein [Blastocatellia bacterium]